GSTSMAPKSRKVARFHIRTRRSPVPTRRVRPSAEKAALKAPPLWPPNVVISLLLVGFQSRQVSSTEALANSCPSAENATPKTPSLCPESSAFRVPVGRFHSLSGLSLSTPPLARQSPSGVMARLLIWPLCAFHDPISVRCRMSKRRIWPSPLPSASSPDWEQSA